MAFGGCLVELAPVGDPAGVREAVAAALALPDPSRLAELIGDRELLIVLDNCEHVIATAAEVAEDLLGRCPALRILATSREGLRVGGETVWPVPPLGTTDAVALFVARAHAAGAALELSDDDRAVIAEICTRLDGLPLAIELAAARTRAFPLSQIRERLDDRFRLLTGGSRTALARQQTLRAVVDWSYELLFDDEQRVFERLSVFPGGCDLATAEEVCSDGEIAAADLADHLHALVDKSLVVAVSSGTHLRFTQLQTLAEYGMERLADRGEAVRIRNAMARHAAALCAQSAAAYSGDLQRAWLTTVDREHDNLRAALEWAVATDDAETALTIAGGTSWFHWLAGLTMEGKRWLDDAFACRGRGGRAHACAGPHRSGPPRFPGRRARALRREPGRGARDLHPPRRPRVDDPRQRVLRRGGRGPQRDRRGPAPAADRHRLLRTDARRSVRDRGARVLLREARSPGRRHR